MLLASGWPASVDGVTRMFHVSAVSSNPRLVIDSVVRGSHVAVSRPVSGEFRFEV